MPYVWDAARGVYLDEGVPVSAEAVRAALRRIVDDSADRLQVLAERFRDGRLDVVDWRAAVRTELRTSYGTAATLANGGLETMGPAERGVLSGQLRNAYGFADQFALDVTQGRVDPASDAFLARARMYSGGAHSSYEAFRRRGASARGEQLERNALEPGANCAGCLAETARGLVPLGELSLPGSRDCLSNCRCAIITERAPVEAGT